MSAPDRNPLDEAGPERTGLAAEPEPARQVWLIVAETGASSVMTAAEPDAGGSSEVVVAQEEGEAPMDFAARVIRNILALERDQRQVGGTVLHLAARSTVDVAAARQLVARALITHAVSTGADLGRYRTGASLEQPQIGG